MNVFSRIKCLTKRGNSNIVPYARRPSERFDFVTFLKTPSTLRKIRLLETFGNQNVKFDAAMILEE